MTPVSRGLLGAQEAGKLVAKRRTPEERAERKVAELRAAPLGGYAWRVAYQEFSAIAKHQPITVGGGRIYTDEARQKAEYLRRVAHRAWKGRTFESIADGRDPSSPVVVETLGNELPEGRSWGYVRTALELIYGEMYPA